MFMMDVIAEGKIKGVTETGEQQAEKKENILGSMASH